MNTWIVSRNPIGVQKPSISVDASGSLAVRDHVLSAVRNAYDSSFS